MNERTILVLLRFYAVLSVCLISLPSCQYTPETKVVVKERSSLNDLANDEMAIEIKNNANHIEEQTHFSQKERAIKLASLYQNILVIEPNREVRTKISYRLAQIETENYELQDEASEPVERSSQSLATLVHSYQTLLARYPNRIENEEIQYQLAKALALQGRLDKSLLQIEQILLKYPNSRYKAELHFRRGDIYYNLQHYKRALQDYQAVIKVDNNANYYVNSVYMSGWTLFKLNRLPESDKTFLSLLDFIVAQEKEQIVEQNFSFSQLNSRYIDLVSDIQRVLSISLSQQSQAKSLVALVDTYQGNEFKDNYVHLYRHHLFKNLADFLIEKGLNYDAETTYQSYLAIAPNSLWAPEYTLLLMDLYEKQGKQKLIKELKIQYVKQFGMESDFWKKNLSPNHTNFAITENLMSEILPNLLSFSYQHSRHLYAKAQSEKIAENKKKTFTHAAYWLNTYLTLAKLPEAKLFISELTMSQGLLADEFLFADASFEAQQFEQALTSYEYIAYQSPITQKHSDQLRQDAAYASTITIRKMLEVHVNETDLNRKKALIVKRNYLDRAYIKFYPKDEKALSLAVQQAKFSFTTKNYKDMQYYCDFILQTHGVIKTSLLAAITSSDIEIDNAKVVTNLNSKSIKEVQTASQLQANYWYQQGKYVYAEASYKLALHYVSVKSDIWFNMRELLAASIYFQGKNLVLSEPFLAVEHYLRLGKTIPESTYRANAHFDAANLLFKQQQWEKAIVQYLAFQHDFPNHNYSSSITAKLAQSYENMQQWQNAAEQYLVIVKKAKLESNSTELQREALHSAADLYLKAGNLNKAITTFRTYAHTYPEPFDIAQEARFKMSQFYQQTKELNKEYYWYRKIINFHNQRFNSQTETPFPRAIYLASIASLELGKAHQRTFEQIKLTLPLNKSLARKKKTMQIATSYYKKLLSFQLVEFVPQGTYNLAQMYRQLARDVMSSQRPQNLDELALEEYDLLLEEIIYPFEEKAIEIHKSNAQRAWQNIYDEWVEKSFTELAELEPALYDRKYQFSKGSKNGVLDAVHSIH